MKVGKELYINGFVLCLKYGCSVCFFFILVFWCGDDGEFVYIYSDFIFYLG